MTTTCAPSSPRIRRRLIAGIGLLALAMVVAAGSAPGPSAAAMPPRIEIAAPSQRVVMFTDSVGLGAEYALPRAFPADWDVYVDGDPAQMIDKLEARYVRPRLASNPYWFGDHVVIAAGYNAPYWDWPKFDRTVDSMINTLTAAGVKHAYWVTLREVKPQYISAAAWRQVQPYYWYFPEVNARLRSALDRHPSLTLVDWAAVADQPGLTYDAIHLNNTGAELYSRIIREAVFSTSTSRPAASITKIHVANAGGAAAAAVNITTTGPRHRGHLRAFVCDQPPPVAAVHTYARAQVVAHAAIVPLDADGNFCVYTHEATNLVVDVTGLFTATTGYLAATPTRWIDTRTSTGKLTAGSSLELDVADIAAGTGIDAATPAIALVATAINPQDAGWLRVATCGSTSTTANVTYDPGGATPNLVIVAPDVDGKVCVTTSSTTDVAVDVFGSFDPEAVIDASTARRVLDSRETGGPLSSGAIVTLDLDAAGVDPDVAGVALNLTTVQAVGRGFLTAYPCALGRPAAANLNVVSPSGVSNTAVVAPDAQGRICVFTSMPTHLVIDLMGTVGESFTGIRPRRVLDTRS